MPRYCFSVTSPVLSLTTQPMNFFAASTSNSMLTFQLSLSFEYSAFHVGLKVVHSTVLGLQQSVRLSETDFEPYGAAGPLPPTGLHRARNASPLLGSVSTSI